MIIERQFVWRRFHQQWPCSVPRSCEDASTLESNRHRWHHNFSLGSESGGNGSVSAASPQRERLPNRPVFLKPTNCDGRIALFHPFTKSFRLMAEDILKPNFISLVANKTLSPRATLVLPRARWLALVWDFEQGAHLHITFLILLLLTNTSMSFFNTRVDPMILFSSSVQTLTSSFPLWLPFVSSETLSLMTSDIKPRCPVPNWAATFYGMNFLKSGQVLNQWVVQFRPQSGFGTRSQFLDFQGKHWESSLLWRIFENRFRRTNVQFCAERSCIVKLMGDSVLWSYSLQLLKKTKNIQLCGFSQLW